MKEVDIIETVERCYWVYIDGKKIPAASAMVAKLLDEDVLFVNSRPYANENGVLCGKTLTLYLNCSDVFAWAYSDAIDITLDELPHLFELYEQNPLCGPIVWACKKRSEKPQRSIIQWLKLKGGWNDELENLPDNKYDLLLKHKNEKKKIKTI